MACPSPVSDACVHMMVHFMHQSPPNKPGPKPLQKAVVERFVSEIGRIIEPDAAHDLIGLAMDSLHAAISATLDTEQEPDGVMLEDVARWVLESVALNAGCSFDRGYNWGWENFRAVMLCAECVRLEDEQLAARGLRVGQTGSLSQKFLDAARLQSVDILEGLPNKVEIAKIYAPEEYDGLSVLDVRRLEVDRGPLGFTITPTLFVPSLEDLN